MDQSRQFSQSIGISSNDSQGSSDQQLHGAPSSGDSLLTLNVQSVENQQGTQKAPSNMQNLQNLSVGHNLQKNQLGQIGQMSSLNQLGQINQLNQIGMHHLNSQSTDVNPLGGLPPPIRSDPLWGTNYDSVFWNNSTWKEPNNPVSNAPTSSIPSSTTISSSSISPSSVSTPSTWMDSASLIGWNGSSQQTLPLSSHSSQMGTSLSSTSSSLRSTPIGTPLTNSIGTPLGSRLSGPLGGQGGIPVNGQGVYSGSGNSGLGPLSQNSSMTPSLGSHPSMTPLSVLGGLSTLNNQSVSGTVMTSPVSGSMNNVTPMSGVNSIPNASSTTNSLSPLGLMNNVSSISGSGNLNSIGGTMSGWDGFSSQGPLGFPINGFGGMPSQKLYENTNIRPGVNMGTQQSTYSSPFFDHTRQTGASYYNSSGNTAFGREFPTPFGSSHLSGLHPSHQSQFPFDPSANNNSNSLTGGTMPLNVNNSFSSGIGPGVNNSLNGPALASGTEYGGIFNGALNTPMTGYSSQLGAQTPNTGFDNESTISSQRMVASDPLTASVRGDSTSENTSSLAFHSQLDSKGNPQRLEMEESSDNSNRDKQNKVEVQKKSTSRRSSESKTTSLPKPEVQSSPLPKSSSSNSTPVISYAQIIEGIDESSIETQSHEKSKSKKGKKKKKKSVVDDKAAQELQEQLELEEANRVQQELLEKQRIIQQELERLSQQKMEELRLEEERKRNLQREMAKKLNEKKQSEADPVVPEEKKTKSKDEIKEDKRKKQKEFKKMMKQKEKEKKKKQEEIRKKREEEMKKKREAERLLAEKEHHHDVHQKVLRRPYCKHCKRFHNENEYSGDDDDSYYDLDSNGDSDESLDPKGYYKCLGVNLDANLQQIRCAYQELKNRYFPDDKQDEIQHNPELQAMRDSIEKAYKVLSDMDEKERYDLGNDDWGDDLATQHKSPELFEIISQMLSKNPRKQKGFKLSPNIR